MFCKKNVNFFHQSTTVYKTKNYRIVSNRYYRYNKNINGLPMLYEVNF